MIKKTEFAIKHITDVKGVNAIYTDKPLLFNPKGLTVVYGDNGSGKSGYIRILKMVSGAKYREDIKNNIYSKTPVHPTASIAIVDSKGIENSVECNLRKPGEHELLTNIDVFDTKVSNASEDGGDSPSLTIGIRKH